MQIEEGIVEENDKQSDVIKPLRRNPKVVEITTKDSSKKKSEEKAKDVEKEHIVTRLPFPGRQAKSKFDEQLGKFMEILKNLEVTDSSPTVTLERTAEIALIRQEVASLLAAAGYVVPEEVNPNSSPEWTEVGSKKKSSSGEGKLPPIVEEECPESPMKGKPLKLTVEDFKEEIEYWNLDVYGYVMGANPPWEVLDGYLRRIWQNYDISKISFLPNGLFVVRFAKLEHQKLVLAQGMFLFDGKPIILRAWDPNVKISKVSVATVPIWAKLVGLDLKFWGSNCLGKLAGLIGKFVKIDELTTERRLLGYARVMVEVEVDKSYPDKFQFEDENGQEVTVLVEYDWLHIACLKCKGVGHKDVQCRGRTRPVRKPVVVNQNGPKQVWRKKVAPERNLDPKEFPVLAVQPSVPTVKGSDKPPEIGYGLITPGCTPMHRQQGTIFTPARILTRVTRHESRMPDGKTSDFIVNCNSELIQAAELVDKGGGGGECLHPLMTKFGVWNIRGLNSDTKQRDVKCGWSFINNNAHHAGGRIWVLWKSHQIHVDILSMDAQFIHLKVKDKATNVEFFTTYVYGFNKIEERMPLWDALMVWSIVDPWVVLGDFNNVMYSNERIGKVVRDAEMFPFQNAMSSCDLQDMKSMGAFFTWTNKQPSETRVYSRIDRVFVNSAWCIVDCESVALPRRKLFKFVNMWSKIGEYKYVVKRGRILDVQGTPMYRVVRKLKSLKTSLKQLNRHLFSDIERNTDIAYTARIECQKQLQNYPRNTVLMDVEYQSRASYLMLAQARDHFLRQKAKVQWVRDGDANTAMFHKAIQQRQIQNKVISIEDAEGKVCNSPEEILDAFVDYYKELLGTSSATSGFYPHIIDNGEKVHTDDWDKLCEIPSDAEIKKVIFSIPGEKSPGPDGYSSCFFKSSWDTIKGDICNAIKDFFPIWQVVEAAELHKSGLDSKS
ncbi:uncharacterized protein LOC141607794 [Silene latifolia]|uniref:uncharacterized protein LOC141607794 n=1 Tax=Silene latifolia TaxID=37657 RepID=UPI003D78ABC8